jgi:UDP-GlcNAc:undecaprenyl-phosphate GlcNAc-1-phosphate transferase
LFLWPEAAPSGAFYAAAAVLVVGGVLDDFFELRASMKMAFQVIAVLIMAVAGGISITTLGDFLPELTAFPWAVLGIPLTLLVAVGVVNAVNMSDGLDGLAGFQMSVALAGLALLAERAGDGASAGVLAILTACVFGFLIFNARVFGHKKAAVFLGDAGTMFLGFTYVWFAIHLSTGGQPAMSPVTALWLLAFPICDMVTMAIRRLGRGRSPFKADKEHLHHVLMMAGFTVSETVMILTAIAVAGAAIGITGELFGVPDLLMLAGFLVALGLYLRMIFSAWRVMRFLRWSICRRRVADDRRMQTEQRRENRGPPANVGERRTGRERRTGDRRSRKLAADAAARAGAPALAGPERGETAEAIVGGNPERAGRRIG